MIGEGGILSEPFVWERESAVSEGGNIGLVGEGHLPVDCEGSPRLRMGGDLPP